VAVVIINKRISIEYHTRISVGRALAVVEADKTNVWNTRTASYLIHTSISTAGIKQNSQIQISLHAKVTK